MNTTMWFILKRKFTFSPCEFVVVHVIHRHSTHKLKFLSCDFAREKGVESQGDEAQRKK